MKNVATSPARYLHLLMRLLEQRDIDCAPALAPLGMARSQLAHPVAKIPRQPAIEVFQQLMAKHGEPALGLQLGERITLGELGDLGLAILCCDTLGEALRCAETFYAVITPSFAMTVDRKSTRLNSSHTDISRMPSSA